MARFPVIVLAALLAASGGAAQVDSTGPVAPFEIGEGLYYVGTEGLAVYLFTSDEGHILLDATMAESVEAVLANIRALGFDPADVRVQLASHAHYDHVGGLAWMRRVTGAEVVISEADAPFVREGLDFGLVPPSRFPPAVVDRTIRHLESVTVGPWTLTAHITPGHTPGCTSWSGEVAIEGRKRRFVSVCSLSVLGSYRLVGAGATYEGQGMDFCRSVAQLRSLDPEVFLASHAAFFGLEEKLAARRRGDALAFVEGQRYRRYLDDAERSIERTLERQGEDGGCDALLEGRADPIDPYRLTLTPNFR